MFKPEIAWNYGLSFMQVFLAKVLMLVLISTEPIFKKAVVDATKSATGFVYNLKGRMRIVCK
jgi:hypothetical protein